MRLFQISKATSVTVVSGLAALISLTGCATSSQPESVSTASTFAPSPLIETPAEHDARMEWWREARFGLFIHWGLYAVPAGTYGNETDYGEWIMTSAQIPVPEYENFAPQFNPVDFNADEWARMAKAAGMKYIVITTKHHDGFALFDSATSDYDIMATPFKRDIMKELADACARYGLKMGWYHSIMDWHHPDYLPRRGWENRSAEGADYSRYVKYLRNQVTELLTNYGPIGIMWFDGQWEGTWTHEDGGPLYDLCRTLQPDVIVNDRVDKGRKGHSGAVDNQFAGDYGTPEQQIPATGIPGVDWETCMTMNRHWGYNKNDTTYKSNATLIRNLVDIASKGGNYLLNVGPKADGTFPQMSIDRLRTIGEWMDVNGEAIHGTTASPFTDLDWGRCTVKTNGNQTTLYLHVFDWPTDRKLVINGLGNKPVGARLLAYPGYDIPITRQGAALNLELPAIPIDDASTVIALDILGAPIVYEAPRISAASRILVQPIVVQLETASSDLEIHYTLDGTDPTLQSPLYQTPLAVADTTTIKARSFYQQKAVSQTVTAQFTRVTPQAPSSIDAAAELQPGLVCDIYAGTFDVLPEFNALIPQITITVPTVSLPIGPPDEYLARVIAGYLKIPADALYQFALTSDDGANLYINDELVVDNDGLHGAETQTGVAALAAGYHRIRIEYFNKTGGAALRLQSAILGEELSDVAPARLSH